MELNRFDVAQYLTHLAAVGSFQVLVQLSVFLHVPDRHLDRLFNSLVPNPAIFVDIQYQLAFVFTHADTKPRQTTRIQLCFLLEMRLLAKILHIRTVKTPLKNLLIRQASGIFEVQLTNHHSN